MQARLRRLRREQGFTVVEVLVAASLLLVGLLGSLTMVDHANVTTSSTRAREGATALQRELLEAVRSLPYDKLTPNSIGPDVRAQGALSDASISASGWTVRRRGFTYHVSLGTCAVDDPRDGTGAHDPGLFCATGAGTTTPQQCHDLLGDSGQPANPQSITGPAALTLGDCGVDSNADGTVDNLVDQTGTTCSSTCADTIPADYKRVVSLVRWDEGRGQRWLLQSTSVANPGSSAAPAITSLTSSAPTTITSASTTTVPLTAAISTPPASFAWYLDGTAQGSAVGASTSWSFNWPLGTTSTGSTPAAGEVLDGTYLVGAKAFDHYGQAGAMRTLTVVVNRRAPFPPQNALGGRNNGVVELEWSPAVEHDVVGYRAYRLDGTTWTQVCSLTSSTSCQDPTPPAGDLTYEIAAVDRDPAGNLREGTRSADVLVHATNTPPPAPASLSATSDGTNTTLTWPAAGPDPDPGDSVDHYDIYRDGQLYSDRYDRTTDATQLSYVDEHTNGQQHTYWVTTVDSQLGESPMAGPVTK